MTLLLEVVKTQNKFKTELKQVIQLENPEFYKSSKDHVKLCKSQIEQMKSNLLTHIDQLHDQIDT